MKKELVKKGLLDKYGRRNERTPADWSEVCEDVSAAAPAVKLEISTEHTAEIQPHKVSRSPPSLSLSSISTVFRVDCESLQCRYYTVGVGE